MTLPEIRDAESGDDDFLLSPPAVERLGALLAGLDQLDSILAMPRYPDLCEDGLPFSHFRLRARLGAGRFGIVVLADDLQLNRKVVVKVPQPAVLADSLLRDRFVREARAGARLDHPGVVSILSTGDVDGLPYLAAKYVAGPSLKLWRQRNSAKLPPQKAAQFAKSVAAAMQHAHERGILHCDLTPSNILLESVCGDATDFSSYQPVVTDFGLARILDEDPSLTKTYQIAGTPHYMAPEQARGDRRGLTARADIYAIGALLYDLLVGHPPFAGDATEVLESVIVKFPEHPRSLVPEIPRDLNAICLKCLEKNPIDRYVSAQDLAEDLRRFLDGDTVTARPVQPIVSCARWVSKNQRISAGIVVALLATFLATGFAIDRWLKEIQIRTDLAVHRAELAETSARAASSEIRAQTAEFYSTKERVRQRRTARSQGWRQENREDLKRLATNAPPEDLVSLRTEAAAVAGGTDLGPRRDLAVGFRCYDVAFSPSGECLAVSGFIPDDQGRLAVRLLDVASGSLIRELFLPVDSEWEARSGGRHDACWSVTFDHDGQRLAVGTRSGWIFVWNQPQLPSEPVRKWRHSVTASDSVEAARGERIGRMFFSQKDLLWTSDSQTAAAWNPEHDWQEVERHSGYLTRPSGGSRISSPEVLDRFHTHHPSVGISVHRVYDERLTIYKGGLPTGNLVLSEDNRADDNQITDMMINHQGDLLISAAEHAGHLKLWDLTGSRLLAARNMSRGSLRLSLDPHDRFLVVSESDRVALFDIEKSPAEFCIGLQPCSIEDMDISQDGQRIAAVTSILSDSKTYSVRVQGLLPGPGETPVMERLIEPPWGNSQTRVAFSAERNQFVCQSKGNFQLYNTVGTLLKEFEAPQTTKDIRFDPQGRLWAIGDRGLWTGLDGQIEIVTLPDSALSLAVGDWGAVVGMDNGFLARCAPDGRLQDIHQVSKQSVTALAAGGRKTIAGTSEGTIVLVEADKSIRAIQNAHNDQIWAVAMGTNGWFATGGADRVVRLWNQSGELILELPQTRPVRRIVWSTEDSTLTILAEGERGARQWKLNLLIDELSELGLLSNVDTAAIHQSQCVIDILQPIVRNNRNP